MDDDGRWSGRRYDRVSVPFIVVRFTHPTGHLPLSVRQFSFLFEIPRPIVPAAATLLVEQ